MKDKLDDKLKVFTDSLLEKSEKEQTSPDFTSAIMAKIEISNESVLYQPLISKPIWMAIAVFVALMIYLAFNDNMEGMQLFSGQEFDLNSWIEWPVNISSSPLMYGLLFLSVLVLVQILFLKNHFHKRLDI